MSTSVALVAGASRGLGLLIARQLMAHDCTVVVCAREREELDKACQLLDPTGERVLTYVCDVSQSEAVAEMVRWTEAEVGPIEVAITVAGVIQVMPLRNTRLEHFEEAVDIMTFGPIHVALAVLPEMRRRGRGRIGTITSIGGAVSVPHLLPYSTAKFGAVGFSRGLSAELAGTGITSTTVVPGLMRTVSPQCWFGGDPPPSSPGSLRAPPPAGMDAERAAQRIVKGVLAGRNQVVLTPLAKIGMRVAGVAPSLTTTAMKVMARLLPSPSEGNQDPTTVAGHTARRRLSSPVVEKLTTLGTRAAHRFNQMQGHPNDIPKDVS